MTSAIMRVIVTSLLSVLLCAATVVALSSGSADVPLFVSPAEFDTITAPFKSLQSLTAATSTYFPIARLTAPLTSVNGGNHRALTVAVGTPPQYLHLMVDTTAGDTLIFNATNCAITHSALISVCYAISSSTSAAVVNPPAPYIPYSGNYDNETYIEAAWSYISDVIFLPLSLVGVNVTINVGYETVGLGSLSGSLTAPNNPPAPLYFMSTQDVNGPSIPLDPSGHLLYTSPINEWYDIDGIIGLSYVSNTLYSTFLNMTNSFSIEPFAPMFALDFAANAFQFGGIDDSYRNDLILTDQLVSNEVYHTFKIYRLTLCGVTISANTLGGLIDTGGSCLALPEAIFDAVVTWLPVECSGVTSYQTNRYCSLAAGAQPSVLPTLTLQLKSGDPTAVIQLPLADLLYANAQTASSSNTPSLCMTRGVTVPGRNNINIILGGRALTNIYTVLNMSTKTVAFANRPSILQSNATCRVPVACRGMQTHATDINVCIDPVCSDYYFFTLDPLTSTCTLSKSFHALISILIVIFVFSEVAMNEFLIYITTKINMGH